VLGGVAAAGDQNPADARHIVASVENAPLAAEPAVFDDSTALPIASVPRTASLSSS